MSPLLLNCNSQWPSECVCAVSARVSLPVLMGFGLRGTIKLGIGNVAWKHCLHIGTAAKHTKYTTLMPLFGHAAAIKT